MPRNETQIAVEVIMWSKANHF